MPKHVVYELFEVTAGSPEEAKSKVEEETSRKRSVVVAASSLDGLYHPAHLTEAQQAFGSIGKKDGESGG